jgi:hypothetical protein
MRVAGVVTDDAGKGSEENPANDWVLFLGRTVSAEPSGHVSLLSSSTATSITMTMHLTTTWYTNFTTVKSVRYLNYKIRKNFQNFRNPHSAVQGFVCPWQLGEQMAAMDHRAAGALERLRDEARRVIAVCSTPCSPQLRVNVHSRRPSAGTTNTCTHSPAPLPSSSQTAVKQSHLSVASQQHSAATSGKRHWKDSLLELLRQYVSSTSASASSPLCLKTVLSFLSTKVVSHELFLISMDDLKNKVPPTHALPPIEMNSFSYVPVAGVDALRAEFVTIGEQLV